MQNIYFLNADDCDMTYQMAIVEGCIHDGPDLGKIVIQYLTDAFEESGVVDAIWPNEKGNIVYFDSLPGLRRFAQKMQLLREIRQAQNHQEE